MSTVKIGWAKRDISTNEPVNINGQMYLRISRGIMDPISVTALCIDGGEGQDAVVFVSCDVTSILPIVQEIVEKKLAERAPHIPVTNVVLNATHTHTSSATFKTPEKSPDGKDIYPGEQYREFFTDMICEAAMEAWDNRTEGGIAFGYGYAVVAHSRRTIYSEPQLATDPLAAAPNGHGVMYGATNKDTFSHYEAGADHFVNALFTVDANNKLTGMVINVPCPSQCSESYDMLSADYWGDVRREVAEAFGSDVFVLPQCAAAGDLSPRVLHYLEAQKRRMRLKYDIDYTKQETLLERRLQKSLAERRDIAERIIAAVKDIHSWAMAEIYTDIPVRHVMENVPLTRRIVTDADKEKCEADIRVVDALQPEEGMTDEEYRVFASRCTSVRNRNLRALERYEALKVAPTKDYPLYVTQIGPVAFAFNPFELYMDFMHRIQARSPFVQTFVTQLAGGGGSSYLPTKRGIENKGYSASIFCNVVGPEGGQELVEFTLKTLNEMKAKDE